MFVKVMIWVFGLVYLRAPNEKDTQRLMKINEKRGRSGMLGRGRSGMLGSVDCMHWR
jgi:hypothetical protein